MAVLDTPITTNEQNLPKILAQGLPVAVYLFRSRDKALDDTLTQLAKEKVGKLLIARLDASDNPQAYQQYGSPALPALITLSGGAMKSKAEAVRPADLRAYVDYLLGRAPMPQTHRPVGARPANGQATPVHITDASFQSAVLNSDLPVLVDFWGPCHAMAPYLERAAGEFAGQVKIAKLNVDENPQTSGRFDVRAIPTFTTFKNGKMVGRQSGADPNRVRALIQQVLSA